MRWAVNLYTTGQTKKKLPRIMQKVHRGKIQPEIRLITLASNPQNLLDIIPASAYIQKGLEKLSPDIVGIAKGQEEAETLAVQIVLDVWQAHKNFDVRKYFKFQE